MSEDQPKSIKVIYVMGPGHTGSTILDIVLGYHQDIEGVGELNKIHRLGWSKGLDRKCACGATIPDCPFWSHVRERWTDLTSSDEILDYVVLQNRYENSRRGWLWLLGNTVKPSRKFLDYASKTTALYRAILAESGRAVVVDSSLVPRRGYALSLMPGVDLRLIHYVRDGRGIIWSLKRPGRKKKPQSAWRTIYYWLSANAQSAVVYGRVRKTNRRLIRYEDFVTNTPRVLTEISSLVDLDMTQLTTHMGNGKLIKARHTAHGNRVRMEKEIRLKGNFNWIDELPEKDDRLFWWVAGWLARRFGYERHPARPEIPMVRGAWMERFMDRGEAQTPARSDGDSAGPRR